MAPKKVVFKGIRTALIVGSVLTLINQWHALFGDDTFRWPAFFLTYMVPFIVFVYSYHSNKHHSQQNLSSTDKQEGSGRQ
jgi:hypothetical protein